MTKPITQKDANSALTELKRVHPTLQERLTLYRGRRESYDAKRLGQAVTPTGTPAEQGARYEPRG